MHGVCEVVKCVVELGVVCDDDVYDFLYCMSIVQLISTLVYVYIQGAP